MGKTKDYRNNEVLNSGQMDAPWNHGKKGILESTKPHGIKVELWDKQMSMGLLQCCRVGLWVPEGIMGSREHLDTSRIMGENWNFWRNKGLWE